jgi:hypothetical protein
VNTCSLNSIGRPTIPGSPAEASPPQTFAEDDDAVLAPLFGRGSKQRADERLDM